MTRQAIEVVCPVPPLANTSTRRARFALHHEKAEQQKLVRSHLETMADRPQLPCRVTLIRIAHSRLDTDGPVMALKYVRDTVARWIHGLDEIIPLRHHGRLVVDKRGRVKTTRPHAPDGPKDGITWAYGQSYSKTVGMQAVRIVIEDLADMGEAERRI